MRRAQRKSYIMKIIFIKKLSAAIVLFSVLLSLVGCGTEDDICQNGIVITENHGGDYSAETEKHAEDVIFYLLKTAYRTLISADVSSEQDESFRLEAHKIRLATKTDRITEAQYNELLDILELRALSVITEFSRALGKMEDAVGLPKAKALYLELSEAIGADAVGELLYDIWAYRIGKSYDDNMKKYAELSDEKYKTLAAEAERQLATLKDGIGEENFIVVTRLGFTLLDTVIGGALESEMMKSFSDAEIVAFVRHIGLSKLTVTADGWELILSELIPDGITPDTDYFNRVLYLMGEVGDTSSVAAEMNDVFKLFIFAADSFTEYDAACLRSGNYRELLRSLLVKFGDDEWAAVEKIHATSLNKEAYGSLAAEYYGDEFTEYLVTAPSATCEELRASLKTDAFYEKLEGYIAGMSPAFSYAIRVNEND